MKKTILYIYPAYSTFIEKDIRFLSKRYVVKTPQHDWKNKSLVPLNFVRQLLFLLRNLPSCKAIIVMFGGYWSFLPALLGKVFGKPVYIILGGTDCVSFPSIQYGSLRKPILATFIKWSYALCKTLVPVDASLVFCQYSYYEKATYPNQGYQYFFPEIFTPHRVIYNGFDADYFTIPTQGKIPNSFILVASIDNMMRFKLKGIDILMVLAQAYPSCQFIVAGIAHALMVQLNNVPDNLALFPALSQEALKQYLGSAQFIMQLSISEGFPNALCEGMLSQCIPIGSAVGAIPHIIGDTGYVIETSDKKYIRRKFDEIVALDEKKRLALAAKARSRIIEEFPIAKREKAFIALIEEESQP